MLSSSFVLKDQSNYYNDFLLNYYNSLQEFEKLEETMENWCTYF